MLAEPVKQTSYVLQPRGKPLYEDESSFGMRMLTKMGWNKDKGLGAKEDGSKEFIRIKYKNSSKGMGFQDRDSQWTQHEDQFSKLLDNLKSETAKEDSRKCESLEEKSKKSRARVHYKKFTSGKDLSQYSEKDLANIFGRKTLKVEAEEEEIPVEESPPESIFGVNTTISRMSSADYFRKMMNAKESGQEVGGSVSGEAEKSEKKSKKKKKRAREEETSEQQLLEASTEKSKKKIKKESPSTSQDEENLEEESREAEASGEVSPENAFGKEKSKKKKKKKQEEETLEEKQEIEEKTEQVNEDFISSGGKASKKYKKKSKVPKNQPPEASKALEEEAILESLENSEEIFALSVQEDSVKEKSKEEKLSKEILSKNQEIEEKTEQISEDSISSGEKPLKNSKKNQKLPKNQFPEPFKGFQEEAILKTPEMSPKEEKSEEVSTPLSELSTETSSKMVKTKKKRKNAKEEDSQVLETSETLKILPEMKKKKKSKRSFEDKLSPEMEAALGDYSSSGEVIFKLPQKKCDNLLNFDSSSFKGSNIHSVIGYGLSEKIDLDIIESVEEKSGAPAVPEVNQEPQSV